MQIKAKYENPEAMSDLKKKLTGTIMEPTFFNFRYSSLNLICQDLETYILHNFLSCSFYHSSFKKNHNNYFIIKYK